jgi:hypothetical protein
VLIQRPIITADDGTAVLGRSPDAVLSVLTAQVRDRLERTPAT